MTSSVREKVATELATINPRVETEVVKLLTDREVGKRSTAIVKCLDAIQTAEGELRKLRPDVVTFDVNHVKTSESYTKARDEERKKLEQRIDKLTKAVNKAIDSADYSDVYNLAAGKDQGTGGAAGSE